MLLYMATIVATKEITLTQIIKFNNKFKYNASKETILAHMANDSFSVSLMWRQVFITRITTEHKDPTCNISLKTQHPNFWQSLFFNVIDFRWSLFTKGQACHWPLDHGASLRNGYCLILLSCWVFMFLWFRVFTCGTKVL